MCWWLCYAQESSDETMIYLDYSATTKPSEEVLQSFVEVSQRYFANPSSLHRAGKQADQLVEKAKNQIRELLNNKDGDIIFTSGGTEANNLAIIGLARAYQHRGKHVITSQIEHPSVLEAMKQLEKEGFEVDYLSVDSEGVINSDELQQKLRKDTVLVSLMHVNNEIGTIQPIEKCSKIINENSRAIFHADCVQSYGKVPLCMRKSGLDAVTISAHKIHGLKGSGILAIKKGLQPVPLIVGGGQQGNMRSGTIAVPHAVSVAKAMRLQYTPKERYDYREIRNRLIQIIQRYPSIRILALETGAPHILSIAFEKIKGEVAVNFFQDHEIYVSTSSACSSKEDRPSHVIEAIQLESKYRLGVIRISFGDATKMEQLNQFEQALSQFMHLLERGK